MSIKANETGYRLCDVNDCDEIATHALLWTSSEWQMQCESHANWTVQVGDAMGFAAPRASLRLLLPNERRVLSPEVQKVYEIFKSAGDSMEVCYGPGHIVFDDYNLRDGDILFCLDPKRWFEHFELKGKPITDIWEFQTFLENSMKAYTILHELLGTDEKDREALSEYLWGSE